MLLIACIAGAYCIGAIPIGFLVAKAKGVDIRKAGSGNIGATNVMRVIGRTLGLLVFVLDVFKGFLPALFGFFLFKHSQIDAFACGMGAVAGHCLSPFLGFKGGKGVATGLGALFGSCPLVAVSAFGVFVLMLLISRYVSLSSIVASASLVPFGFVYHTEVPLIWALGCLGLFVISRHGPNIKRLIAGSESKFTFGSKSSGPKASDKTESPSESSEGESPGDDPEPDQQRQRAVRASLG